jgi:Dolichyl-phosphate-mannose-protein mannosyltransferase
MRPLTAALPEVGAASAVGSALAPRQALRAERAVVVASLAVLSGAYFYAAMSRSMTGYFWMDEVLAVSAAAQSSLTGVWNAIWTGTDFSPPTYHFLLHGFVKAVGAADSRLVWRIPSILAVYGAALCVYTMLRSSGLSRIAAVLGFGIVAAFGLFDFAVQVRQYALLVLGLAAALLLWSSIESSRPEKGKAVCLWAILSFCLCLHFYSAIEVAVIGVAELIYAISRRRVRWCVWMALVLTAPIELALYPLAAHLAAFTSVDSAAPAYYGKPTLDAFESAIFKVVMGGGYGTLLLLALLLLTAWTLLSGRTRPSWSGTAGTGGTRALVPSTLEIAIISLCLLPLMGFAFSVLVTKSFSARYIAAGALLPALLVPYIVDRLRRRQIIAAAFVPFVAAVLVLRAHAHDPIADALAVLHKDTAAAPIVVGEGGLYIELMEAADSATRSKLVYLVRPPGTFSPDPTNENETIRLATFHPEYQVEGLDAFLEQSRPFYVLSRRNVSVDTTTPALMSKGALKKLVTAENGILLYRSWDADNQRNGGGQ